VVRVTAHYGGGKTGTASVAIRFVDFRIARVPLPADVAVSAPLTKGSIGTRLYAVPVNLVPLADQDFGATGRSTVEYVLTAAASPGVRSSMRWGTTSL
jgi:hypothetical protein